MNSTIAREKTTTENERDSLDVVDLIMSVEDEFSVEVPDEALENIRTVEDMVKYIEDNM